MYGRNKELTPEQKEFISQECTKLPPHEALFTRQQAGITLTYLDSVHLIKQMNRIFGVEGWSHNISDEKLMFETEGADGKWRCAYKVTVCVNTDFGVYHEDIGLGSGVAKDRAQALKAAVLEAPTDALKRAVRFFGESLGLALYSEGDRTAIFVASIQAVTDAASLANIRETLGKFKTSFSDDQYIKLASVLADKKKELGL